MEMIWILISFPVNLIYLAPFYQENDDHCITLREGIGILQNLSSGPHTFYKQACWLAQLILKDHFQP